MGRVLDLFIAVATLAVALFGVVSGALIYVRFAGAALGPTLVAASAVGGLFGVAKLVRTRDRSSSGTASKPSGSAGRL